MKLRKVLIITYYWPPYGGTGTYRILKFVKNLSQFGYEPIILTTKYPDAPIYDESLLKEVPEGIKVYRTKKIEFTTLFRKKLSGSKGQIATNIFQSKPKGFLARIAKWIRLNMFIPDAKIGWYRFAVRMGKQIIRREKPDLIFSTSPPPTTQLIARRLANWSGLKWVADFRDPWTKIFYLDGAEQIGLARRRNEKYEMSVLRDCSAFTAVNDGFFPHLKFQDKMTVIPNGFDASEFPPQITQSKNSKFTIRYLGGWKQNQHVDAFFNLLREISRDREMAQSVVVETFGYIDDEIRKQFLSSDIKIEIHHKDYADRSATISNLLSADMLILIIGKSRLQDQGFSTKLFEYMYARKPILAFGPISGSAAKVLEETGSGKMFTFEDFNATMDFFIRRYADWKLGVSTLVINEKQLEQFDFRYLTSKLVATFEKALNT